MRINDNVIFCDADVKMTKIICFKLNCSEQQEHIMTTYHFHCSHYGIFLHVIVIIIRSSSGAAPC